MLWTTNQHRKNKCYIYIGRVLEPHYFPHGLSWIKNTLETLGIHITTNLEENINYNFKPKIATLKNNYQYVNKDLFHEKVKLQ